MPKHKDAIFAELRRQKMSDMVLQNGTITVSDLCRQFSVSPATVRLDLSTLEQTGVLKRTHGGALSLKSSGYELTTQEKLTQNVAEKAAIAHAATAFIHSGDAIAIDTGTTGFELAKQLVSFSNLTVVTNDIEIAGFLEANSDFNVLLLGGIIRKHFHCTVGNYVLDALSSLHVDTLFLATNGVSASCTLSTPSVDIANVKRKMIEIADQVVLIADKSKFEHEAFASFANLSELTAVISDAEYPSQLKNSPELQHVQFLHVDV